MIELNETGDIQRLAKALNSGLRLEIIRLLSPDRKYNIDELAGLLHVTNGAMTAHIRQLQEAGILDIELASGRRGSQKICRLRENSFLIRLVGDSHSSGSCETELPVGGYCRYRVQPTCGISTVDSLIGEVDDPRYFADPRHSEAGILWLAQGFVEYRIPNYMKADQRLARLQLSFEISSEAPGYCNDWPSDIHFSINGHPMGFWTSPGDFGGRKGLYTPAWWLKGWNQYGLLKWLEVNDEGTFVDGGRISDTRIGDLGIGFAGEILFRLEVPDTASHPGGMTLFGRGFGNYNQGIRVCMDCETLPGSAAPR